ncbi:glycoside hydrolase family 24 protein [Pseudomonas akapageensis]|uniref:glycoside hydrolase family 24 protein n=1 Tax=Pseudomonas akapageensis TaxID=2609961 RepID=UPI00140C272D|nr:glycoside hydrolase family 104 protein [Pseudomonas akapageensis]
MAKISDSLAGSKNALAFLDMLAWSEGTSTSKHTHNDGYDVIVGGIDSPNIFTSYADHPGVLVTVNRKGLRSTAAGRYQQMKKDWPHYRDLLKLPDFSPISQDKLALQHIQECRALPDVHAGRIAAAIAKCRNIWASLPEAGYGQREHKLNDLIACYIAAGGRLT